MDEQTKDDLEKVYDILGDIGDAIKWGYTPLDRVREALALVEDLLQRGNGA